MGLVKLNTKISKNNKDLSRLVLAVAIVEPMMTLPQIQEIWVNHQTGGVSLLTWALYFFSSVVWFVYGLAIKDKALTVTGLLWIIVDLIVVIGVLIY